MTPAHMRATLTCRREITADLCILRIRPEEPLAFQPGQYVTVGLPDGERLIERPYSVASAPHEPELEFFLERIPGGRLSPQLCDLEPGSVVYLRRQAKGLLLLDRASGRPCHFMVATVTGVAPFLSILRHLARAAESGEAVACRILLLHAASVPAEFGYYDELSSLAARFPWFDYFPTVSRPWLCPDWQGERGRAEDVARKYLDLAHCRPDNTVAYLCGNPNMIVNLEGLLLRAGFPPDSIRREMYWPAGRPSASPSD